MFWLIVGLLVVLNAWAVPGKSTGVGCMGYGEAATSLAVGDAFGVKDRRADPRPRFRQRSEPGFGSR